MLDVLKGNKHLRNVATARSPFEVADDHISALNERMLHELLRRLLNAEAHTNGIHPDRIHVASNIHAPDGGIDGYITWKNGPARTDFLPSRQCYFQLKSGQVLPSKAARELLARKGEIKDMVRLALEDNGNYILLCTHDCTPKGILERETRMVEAVRDTGIDVSDDQIAFRDSSQIASWTNRYPSIALWVMESTRPGSIGPFHSQGHWAGRFEHSASPWVDDERLAEIEAYIRERIGYPRKILRFVGLSGIGKSRLILESLGQGEGDRTLGCSLSDLVMYAAQSESGLESINTVVQSLADSGQRAVVVVDDCDVESHEVLAGMVSKEGSHLSLITIDHDVPTGTLTANTIRVAEAPSSVTEGIINRISPDLQSEDKRRLERFSEGFPKIAILVTQAWDRSAPIAHATDDALVDAFVTGRSPHDRGLLLKSAALLSTFPLLGVEGTLDHQLQEVANLGLHCTFADLYAGIGQLVDRNVAERKGRLAVLQPRPIALRMAERQWKEWSPATWERVLSGDVNRELKISAARQLALLNTTETAKKVVAYVCRYSGPFDDFEDGSSQTHAEVLSALAEIDADIVVQQIERSLEQADNLLSIRGDTRRHLVVALEKIAFHAETFAEGASLLLRLAVAENEPWSNNATGQFTSLFSMMLGGTEATGKTRHSLLDDLAYAEDSSQRDIVVAALTAGCNVGHFSRMVSAEVQGSRPALVPWRPATNYEAIEYVEGCVLRLARFALLGEESGSIARAGLGQNLRTLITRGFIDIVEKIVDQAADGSVYWPELLNGLNMVLAYDQERIDVDISTHVKQLVNKLQPSDLAERVRYLVTDMPWDYPSDEKISYEERSQRQIETIRKLAMEILDYPVTLEASLSGLSRGQQRMTYLFGNTIAKSIASPLIWLDKVVQTVVAIPEKDRNYDLLSGFLSGLEENDRDAVESFKQKSATTPELASVFPLFFRGLKISESDIDLAIGTLRAGLLPPGRLLFWSYGSPLDDVPPASVRALMDALLAFGHDGFVVAVNLLGMHIIKGLGEIREYYPQIVKLAGDAALWRESESEHWLGPQMTDFFFEHIMERVLDQGRGNSEACATAMALATVVAQIKQIDDDLMVRPLLPQLLSNYPEVAWPLIGQAVVDSEPLKQWLLEQVLGDSLSFERKSKPAILHLPESTLFAWCRANPGTAPAFVAKILPILDTGRDGDPAGRLHSLMARLFDEFGDRVDVQQAFEGNLHTFISFGSGIDHYSSYEVPLGGLLHHSNPNIRIWVKGLIHRINATKNNLRNWNDEVDAKWEI